MPVNLAIRFADPTKRYARSTEAQLVDDHASITADLEWRRNHLVALSQSPHWGDRKVDEDPELIQYRDELAAISARMRFILQEKTRNAELWRAAERARRPQLALFGR